MLVEMVERFLMVSLYLYSWGIDRYEDWLVIGAAAGMTRLFDFGMEYHFGNALRLSLAAGDRKRFERSLATGLSCYAIVMIAIVLLISAVVWLAPVSGLLGSSVLNATEVSMVLWLMVIQRVILLPRPFIRSIYAAHGEFSRGENMFTIFSIGATLTSAVMLLLGAGPVAVAVASIFSALVACWTVMISDQRRRYPDVSYRPAIPTLKELKGVAGNASFYMLPLWAELLLVQGPVLMIGLLARESGGVLMFTLGRTLVGLARQGAIQLARSGGIEMARQVVQKDRAGALSLHRGLGRSIGGLTGLVCGVIWVVAESALDLWTGGRVPFDPLIVLALMSGVLFAGPAQANVMLLQLANVPRPLALSSLLQVSIVGSLGLALIPHFGPLGAAIAVGLADALAFAVVSNEAAARAFKLRAERYAAVAYGSELVGLTLGAGIAWALMRWLPLDTVPSLALFFALWGLLLVAPGFFLVLDARQRSRVIAHLRGLPASRPR